MNVNNNNWLHALTKVSAENTSKKNEKVPLPDEETFAQILDKAKNGNEMAALHILEWQKYCVPKNDKDTDMVTLINNAAKKLWGQT